MPLRTVKLHVNDAQWITPELKELISLRQQAFAKGNQTQFKHYRNAVNRLRKSCRSTYYNNKVANLKRSKPKQWWNDVKRIAGMTPSSGNKDLLSLIQSDGTDNLSEIEIADLINRSFLEPMSSYQPLDTPPFELDSDAPILSEESAFQMLSKICASKASGPDGVPNWVLKDYAALLAVPVCNIINSSYAEQRLTTMWKHANITPIPKEKPVTNICKHLRPVSLTPTLSKMAEEFIVHQYIAPAILEIIDPNQYDVIPRSSTTQALVSMLHRWSEATDASGSAVRIVLLDYRKAFDLVDHIILAQKIYNLNIPRGVARWVCDFLSERKQRVKLSNDCLSDWGRVPSGVPQGTKLGPWLFILMINDLNPSGAYNWKFVDDTTLAEIVPKGDISHTQELVNEVGEWSSRNQLELNADKCKELRIDFKKTKSQFDPIVINNKEFNIVDHAKILGVTISNSLQWNDHVSNITTKANKRLYFLVLLRRAKVPVSDMINFYCTCIRPVLEYCAPVFHHALPEYLKKDLEQVQRRALSIVLHGTPYEIALKQLNIDSLNDRRNTICMNYFEKILNDPTNKINSLIKRKSAPKYNLRKRRRFEKPIIRTNRFLKSFIPSMCNILDS